MTDRELLERAARAMGLRTDHKWNRERMEMTPPVIALVVHDANGLAHTAWDPLDDDGASLRLAMKCGIQVWRDGDLLWIGGKAIEFQGDPLPAARRAIVSAAAEMAPTTT